MARKVMFFIVLSIAWIRIPASVQAGEIHLVTEGVSVSGYNNGNWAGVYFSGPIVPDQINTGVWAQASSNPQPGNIGNFIMVLSAYGNFLENGQEITPKMWDLYIFPISANSSLETTDISTFEDGENIYLNFTPQLVLNSNAITGLWIDSLSDGPNNNIGGWILGDFNVYGGRITSIEPTFESFTGTEYGVPDWQALTIVHGVITSPDFTVTITPEPASLTLMCLGGVAAIYHRRQRLA